MKNEKPINIIHHQVKQITDWNKRKFILLFVLLCSAGAMALSFYHFARGNYKLEQFTKVRATGINTKSLTKDVWAYSGTAAAVVSLAIVIILLMREINRRKKINDAVWLQKEYYRITINSIAEGLITTGKNGEILHMNPAAEKITGWRNEEVKNFPLEKVYNVTNESTGKPFEHIVKRILKTGHIVEFENNTLLQTKNNDKLIISNFGSPLIDKRGNISGTVLLFNDITEKIHAENTLKQSKEFLQKTLDLSLDIICTINAAGQFVTVSTASKRILGYEPDELIGNLFINYVTHADIEKTLQVSTEIMGGLQIVDFENRYHHKNGNLVPVQWSAFWDAESQLMYAVARDITERKKAEEQMLTAIERYEILSQATSDTIWDWDFVENKILYNSGVTKMFGYLSPAIVDVFNWWKQKVHPDDLHHVTDAYFGIIKNNQQTIQLEYQFRCADGTYKYIYDRAFVMYDADKKPVRMIGAMQDVSYEKEEEKRIAKAIIDTQEHERNQIGLELHDNVNQILVGALLHLGMAGNVPAHEASGLVEKSKEYINEAITEIRILSHRLAPATFDDISLKEIFEGVIKSLNVNNQFKYKLSFEGFEGSQVNDDIQVNLLRVLQEQLNNIVKYARAGSIDISVVQTDHFVTMRIADDGIGFHVNKVKRGIGLSNIKKRAETLKGKFLLNSSPGNGCEIKLEIPLGAELSSLN